MRHSVALTMMENSSLRKSPGTEMKAVLTTPLFDEEMTVWASECDEQTLSTMHSADASNNSQLLLIAVEYVNDENMGFDALNTSDGSTLPQGISQPFIYDDQVSALDPNMGSTAQYSPVYTSDSTQYNQNPIVLLPKTSDGNDNISLPVDGMYFLRQVVSSRLNQQPSLQKSNMKRESESVEFLITDQNGISYTRTQENLAASLTDQTDLSGLLSSIDQRLPEDRLLDAQGLALDSNMIGLDELVLMKSNLTNDLPQVVHHIDINIEPSITDPLPDTFKEVCNASELSEILNQEDEPLQKIDTDEYTVKMESADAPARRQPKRQFFGRDDLCDDEIIDDGTELYTVNCPDCPLDGTDELVCPRHRVQSISDKPVPSRARATLPASYLSINKVGNDENGEPIQGVFARKLIPKRTQFGPIEGVMVPLNIDKKYNIELVLESDSGEMYRLDVSDENMSNWMRFVRKATTVKNQNLLLNQIGSSLYYITTCNILPRQELRVGYSTSYADKRELKLLEREVTSVWSCFECTMTFTLYKDLQKHLCIHDKNDDKKLKSKKCRTKKRNPVKKENEPNDGKDVDAPSSDDFVSSSEQASDHDHFMATKDTDWKYSECNVKTSTEDVTTEQTNQPIVEQQQQQQQQQQHSCSSCDLVFDGSALLESHLLFHRPELLEEAVSSSEWRCPRCVAHFASQYALVLHVAEHAVAGGKPKNKCPLCYKSFATDERLERHMLVHGSDESKPLQCTTCNKRFVNNSALICHVKTHKLDRQIFECPVCRQTFDQVLPHKEHVKTHCVNGTYTCPHCKKDFKEYSVIRKHIRAFHCDRKHKCLHCDKPFPTLDKLRMHLLKHSDHREFLCASCGKQFKRKDKLKEHTKRMHGAGTAAGDAGAVTNAGVFRQTTTADVTAGSKRFVPKVSPTDYHRFIYKCHACMQGFKRRGMLVNHLAKRHPDIRPDTVPELNLPILRTTRDYYCQYCDKVYKSSSKRKAHIIKNHPGATLPASNRNREAGADTPDPTFSQTVGSVTTDPHNCRWCHKQYASKAKLLQHQRKKHPEHVAPRSMNDIKQCPDDDPLQQELVDTFPTAMIENGNTYLRVSGTEQQTQDTTQVSVNASILQSLLTLAPYPPR